MASNIELEKKVDALADSAAPVRVRAPRVVASLFGVLGAVLLVGGVRLATLGGSLYYLIAGAVLIASGVLLWRRRWTGAWLYALFTLGTIVWALWESGFDGWALAPRVLPFLVLGMLLLRPGLRSALLPHRPGRLGRSPVTWVSIALLIALCAGVGLHQPYPVLPFPTAATAATQSNSATADWRHWGRTLSGTRYAPFEQINTSNVKNLQVAWTHRTGAEGGFRATPLQVGDTLYMCVEGNIITALDVDTGDARWRFEAGVLPKRMGLMKTCRGVSYYETPQATGACARRILSASADGRLLAVDADTGKRCSDFGNNGEVDLLSGLGNVGPGSYQVTSPPTVTHGLAIIGSAFPREMSGVVRAFDAQTGALRWAWDIGRPEPVTALAPGETYTQGTPNAWSIFSADEALGLVYIPVGNPTHDYFGANRTAQTEKYGSSVVALETDTGRVRWSFQTVHHDLWDYDVPAQPVLTDLTGKDGAKVPALIASTKRGEVFLLDRRTGAPLAPVEERPVPQTDVPLEWTAKTQPFSVGMPSFGRDRLTEAKMWGITPIDQMLCRIEFRQLRYEGPLTPPSLGGSLQYPGAAGGMNWGSVSVDEAHQVMVVNVLNLANRVQLIPRAQVDGKVKFMQPQEGTPYGVVTLPMFSKLYAPCQQPPYGELAAVDLTSKKVLWRRPLGSANELGPLGLKSYLPLTMGVINSGGSLVTQGGLVFYGGTLDGRLRAFDIRTGEVIWTTTLPNSAHSTPMTFISPKTKRQYIVTTVPTTNVLQMIQPHGAARHAANPNDPNTGGYVIAYALPAPKT